MIFEVNSPGYRTTFEHRDVGNPHQFSVTRYHDSGYRITRYNTHEECAVQLVGLTRIHHGHGYEVFESDHHKFDFKKEGEHVRIRCITKDQPDDEFHIWGSEAHTWMWNYAKCIWEHDFERQDNEAITALQNDRDKIIEALGEEPPFLQKIPENQKRHEEAERRENRNHAWLEFGANVLVAVMLMAMIGAGIVALKLAYTGVTSIVTSITPLQPVQWVDALKRSDEPDFRGVESKLDKKKMTLREEVDRILNKR